METIEECDNSVIDERERYWIAEYNSYRNGYNLTVGGDGHNVIDKEDVEYIIALWELGLTEKEISERCGINHKAVKRILYQNGIARNDIVKRAKASVRQNLTKCIYVYDTDGNYLKEYPSVRDASADLGIHHTTIGHVASGRDAHCHGLVFRYFKADKIAKTKVYISKREVHQYALTGEYIASYQTLRDACKAVGLSDPHGIRDSCKSEKTASGGYQWRYYKTDSVGGLNNLKHHYS